MKKAKKSGKKLRFLILVAVLILLSAFGISRLNPQEISYEERQYLSSLPENIQNLYEKNPDTADFVFSYSELYGTKGKIDLKKHLSSKEVPLFMQWDKRWGYMEYSGDCVGISGCGPVCLSMVALHLTKDEAMSPDKIIEFAADNKYYAYGNGSLWTLISEGGKKLGLNVEELPLSESIIKTNLQEGNPIICIMGPGDFTSSGHFIVMRKYKDGKIWVNDPNSYENSEKGWTYSEIKDQIRNLWACSV